MGVFIGLWWLARCPAFVCERVCQSELRRGREEGEYLCNLYFCHACDIFFLGRSAAAKRVVSGTFYDIKRLTDFETRQSSAPCRRGTHLQMVLRLTMEHLLSQVASLRLLLTILTMTTKTTTKMMKMMTLQVLVPPNLAVHVAPRAFRTPALALICCLPMLCAVCVCFLPSR